MSDAPKSKLEEIQERRTERAKAEAAAAEAQLVTDLEALEVLEEEHGVIAAVKVARFREGHPTRAFLRTPKPAEYKRYVDSVSKSYEKKNQRGQRDAQEILAKSCWVYPEDDKAKDAMLEAFPGLLTSIAIAAAALAEGKQEEEGKG